MKAVNLIPGKRRQASARRAVLRGWIVVAGIYTACATVVSVVVYMTSGVEMRVADDAAAAANQQFARASDNERSMRMQATKAQRDLEAAHAVGKQPDWSILLAVLAKCRGDHVTNTSLDLTLTTSGASHERAKIALIGEADTLSALSKYVLELERSQIFAAVTLAKSQALAENSSRVSFKLDCVIEGGVPIASPGTAPPQPPSPATANAPDPS